MTNKSRFYDGHTIWHPDFGLGVIHDSGLTSESNSVSVSFDHLKEPVIPAELDKSYWENPSLFNVEEVLVRLPIKAIRLVSFGCECTNLLNRAKTVVNAGSEYELFAMVHFFKNVISKAVGFLAFGFDSSIGVDYKSNLLMRDKSKIDIAYVKVRTARFGVKIDIPPRGLSVQNNAQFNAWYQWWESARYEILGCESTDISEFITHLKKHPKPRPVGDWRSLLN